MFFSSFYIVEYLQHSACREEKKRIDQNLRSFKLLIANMHIEVWAFDLLALIVNDQIKPI